MADNTTDVALDVDEPELLVLQHAGRIDVPVRNAEILRGCLGLAGDKVAHGDQVDALVLENAGRQAHHDRTEAELATQEKKGMATGLQVKPSFTVENEKAVSTAPAVNFGQ